MNLMTRYSKLRQRSAMVALGFGLVVVCAGAQENEETEERIRIAAANMEDAIVVDCQLPGKLRRLGGTRNYLTPGRLIRASAIVCRTRGGEYTLGDLASGTLSLQRWMVPAKDGDAEAQYYVARIYANGMDNVDIDYAEAASWYQMAADQGYAEAKQELGYLYERGLGVEQDSLKALNLQREASGLGDALDYAYKIDDANALAENLATQLNAANSALADSQLELMDTQAKLTAARNDERNALRRIRRRRRLLSLRDNWPASQRNSGKVRQTFLTWNASGVLPIPHLPCSWPAVRQLNWNYASYSRERSFLSRKSTHLPCSWHKPRIGLYIPIKRSGICNSRFVSSQIRLLHKENACS